MAEAQQQRYRVIDRLAAGGMAEVFRAESAGLEGFKKKVAIKRVLPHLSEKKRFIQMFLDEARLGAHLSHSNCVQVFDIGVGDNTYFIVMEYVDGADLKACIEWLKKQGKVFPVGQAVYITIKMCEGLAYAHELADERGVKLEIVHRDLSPPNVLITRFGEIKIVDFGLAKASTQLEKSEPGIIKGKFSYLSPEAAMGQEVDLRTDIFAAAIILWEMLAGRKLFQGETDFETVKMVQRAEIPSLRSLNPEVDAKLEAIINKGLARDIKQRYGNARDFANALNDWLYEKGRGVSAFEIAEMVQLVVKERERAKQGGKPGGANIIDSLIQQTLFEFTSLDNKQDASAEKPQQTNKPLDAGKGGETFDLQDWGSELSDLAGGSLGIPAKQPQASLHISQGDLAALEEDPAVKARAGASAAPKVVTPEIKMPDPTPEPEVKLPPPPTKVMDAPTPKPTPSNTPMIVGVVVVLGALAAGGAYAAGLFK